MAKRGHNKRRPTPNIAKKYEGVLLRCHECKQYLPADRMVTRERQDKTRCAYWCKDCQRKYMAKYRSEHRADFVRRQREYRQRLKAKSVDKT